MSQRSMLGGPLLLFLLAPCVTWQTPAHGTDAPSLSHECGECHRDIYRMWRESAHAQSMDSPVFLDAVRETEARASEEVSRICLRCHAPSVEVTQDHRLSLKSTWEGVSCDVCHALSSVDLSGPNPRLVLKPGPIKRGPIRDAQSGAHETEFSPLHSSAEICAPCHEYANALGMPIMTTYSEWRESAAAKEGKTCQHCHMARTEGQIVDPRIARLPEAQVNLHQVPGGHSIEMLNNALGVDFELHRAAEELVVEVTIENRGAGHSVPTGMPGRRVILEISVRSSGGEPRHERRVFGATFVDAAGEPIERDSGYFSEGARRLTDTRIVSGAAWNEAFRFPVSARETAYAGLRLTYEHLPLGPQEAGTRTTFYSTDRVSLPGGRQ